MTTRRHGSVAAAVLLLSGVVVAACSDGAGTSGTASGGDGSGSGEAAEELAEFLEQPTAPTDWPVLGEAPPPGKSVYYVNTGNGAAQPIAQGIEDASEALGWDYHGLTYTASNPATGNSAYLSAVSAGADVIISTGLVEASITEGLQAAEDAGVEVVHISGTDSPDSELFDQVGNLQVNVGRWADAAVLGILADAEASGTTAKVGVVSTSGIPVIQANADAFVDAMEQRCSNCEASIIDVPAGDFTTGQAPESVVSFMQRNPATGYIHVIGGDFQGGLRPALDSAGLQNVNISGLIPGTAQNTEVESGDALFWVQIPNEYHGWLAIDAAARSFTGGDSALHNQEEAPVWVVNQDNLDFDVSDLPDFPAGYRDELTSLWNVD